MSDVVPLTQWHNSGMIPISISALPVPGPISIEIGLEVTAAINYNPDIVPVFLVDNFNLFVQSKVTPSQLNLQMDGIIVDGGAGYGNCTFIPSTPWQTTPVKVNFTWVPTDPLYFSHDVVVTFTCDTNLFASKVGQTLYTADPSKTGLSITTDQGANTTWTFQYYVNLPTGYWDHSLVISQPSDWTFTFVSEPQLPLINRLNECILGSITIPTTNITISPDGYWRFEAYSPNYLTNIQPQIYNGTQWINSTQFQITNLTRIISQINNGTGPPPNLASSSINLTIYDSNNQLWYTYDAPTFSNGWAIFPNLTIFGINTTAGAYQVSVAWDNGVEGGYRESSFNIVHDAEMVLSKPTDAVADLTTEVVFGDLLLIRVGLNDTDSNELVKNVSLTLNWTQGGGPVQKSMIDLETGQYEIVLDTSDLPSIDNYTIIIDSYSPYFLNSSLILYLIVTTETFLSSPQYPKTILEWGQNTTIQVNYVRAIDEIGLNNSIIMVNWTLGPYSITEAGNGAYNIEINLTYAGLMEYTLEINASKPNCAFKILKLKLEIIPIETELTSPQYPKVITEWAGSNITIDVDYHTLSAQGINNSIISVNWTQSYSITPFGSGIYRIELNTTLLVQEYSLEIIASKLFHQNKTLSIIIKIESVETLLTSPQFPKIISYWGENITFQIDYQRALSEVGILNATISMNWSLGSSSITEIGNGQYDIELNLSFAEIVEYTLEINASKANYELKTINIRIEVKAIDTELISASYPRVVAEWGTNITIIANFRTAVGLKGINGSTVTNNWTGSSVTELGNGQYQIVLNASLSLGDSIIEISANKQYYVNKTLQITVEINAIETELVSTSYPRVISEWGTNITIIASFHKVPGLDGVNGSIVSSNWTGSSVTELGNGQYQIVLNASLGIGEFLIEINTLKAYHQNQTLLITIQIDAINTELISNDYPRVISEWNINITIIVNYREVSGLQGIPNALISTNWSLSANTLSDLGSGLYQIELNTSLIPGEYVIEINLSKQYHTNKTLKITVQINSIETELTSTSYPRVIAEWGTNVTIIANYRMVEGLIGINSSTVNTNWTASTITELGNGLYQIELNASKDLGEYFLVVTASKQYHGNKSLQIIVQIVPIGTEFLSPSYPRVIAEWGTNITIVATFRKISGLNGINSSVMSSNWTGSTVTELGNGQYQIIFNASAGIGEFTIVLNILKGYHQNQTLSIIVQIDAIGTELISASYPRVITEWGTNVTIIAVFREVAGLAGINGSTVSSNWTISSVSELGNGQYQIELNASTGIGEYTLEINTLKQYHENKSLQITIQIDVIGTELLSNEYPRVVSEWNFNTTITINYRAVVGLQGISNAIISINWSLSDYTIRNLGAGLYQIELNSSIIPQEYIVEINASSLFHANKSLQITVQVNAVETELISQEYPRVIGEWGKNITVVINYRTAIGHYGIDNAIVTANWTLTYYSITSIGSGLYQIDLNTSWCNIQEYLLEVNTSRLYHSNKTIKIIIQINLVETVLVYDSVAAIPYGQNATINLKYTDLAGNPIASASNGSDLLTVNYTHWVSYNDSLPYPFSIVVQSLGLNQSDLLNITAVKSKYKPQSVLIFLTYRPIFTTFTNLNDTIISLPIGESSSILVVYNDTDFNQGIPGANLTFYGYNNLSFADLGGGIYRITINATDVVDAYSILVTIAQFGYVENNIQFVVQVKDWADFAIITIPSYVETEPVGSAAYFSLVLEDDFSGTFFDDITVIYSWAFGTGNLTFNGNGNYSLILDTTNKPAGTYTITINATSNTGYQVMSQTVNLVITSEVVVSWWIQYSWVFGILGAVVAIAAGYRIRGYWRQRNWAKKVKHIYILTKTGIPLYDKRLGGVSRADPSLVTSALIGISSIVQEIVHSKRVLKTIDHMDNKILFSHGFHIIVAVLSEIDLPVIRNKLNKLTNRFEYYYGDELASWKGDVDTFFGANKVINEFFPIEEYLDDKQISSEWILERLFNMYGLPGIVTLLTMDLGLTDSKKIAAGSGINVKLVDIIVRTFADLILIDSEGKLTKRGKNVIKIYKARKEKYINILKMAKRKQSLNNN